MIRRNIDASLGLVNGTIATVVSIIEDPSTNNIEKIKLLLPSTMEYLIERVSVKFEIMDRAYVIRKQFPLSLSYGITIHKSQGLSLRNAVMDIGNSVFNCGQVYVALSRVTSIDGLYLINYDPSSIKASEEAIIEYNRLKQIYKGGAAMITISKERHRKVKDVPWTLLKMVSHVQEPPRQTQQNTGWIINGFQNTDKVSCYANAVLQCLLYFDDIRKVIISNKLSVLDTLTYQYEKGMAKLSTYSIRQYLGEYFASNIKRDATEFLTAFCEKYNHIKNLLQCEINTTSRCKSCDNTKCITVKNIIISISTNNLKKKSYDLQSLINNTFSHWYQSCNDVLCDHCAGNDMLFKNEIIFAQKIIVLHIKLFSLQDGKLQKIQKLNLLAVPTTKLVIAGQFYKVMNAIFHHGPCIDNGYYTSICREESSNVWIEAHDTEVKKRQWPRGAKDIYIIVLRKIDTYKNEKYE